MTGFAELVSASNFSFLRGASHPEEMVAAASALGLSAIGVADRNSLAGAVRAWKAGKQTGIKVLTGVRLVTTEGMELACYPVDLPAYSRLCRLLTLGNRRAPKGECWLTPDDIIAHSEGQILILIPPREWTLEAQHAAQQFAQYFSDRDQLFVALVRGFDGRDGARLHAVRDWARRAGVPAIVSTDALYHTPERRMLQDVVSCIREGTTIDAAGRMLEANAERHLKPPAEMARLFPQDADALARTEAIAARIGFSLDQIAYQYPDEVVDPGETAMQTLTRLTEAGARWRYPDGIPARVRKNLDEELRLIAELNFAPYFLTVHDLVRYARSQDILCQGRGSAANSSVCYCLGVTEVDPATHDLLFARFLSSARNEPPDIDVDFEHERREEVIQYVYGKYGRHRAAMTATVISYRAKGAVREVAKAMGLSLDMADALSRQIWGWSKGAVDDARVRELGLDPQTPRLRQALALTRELIGFPRHLSQHPGGFVITRDRLDELVPVMNAAMADRTMIEWDKDDIDALKMMKVDVLGLGMLSLMAGAFRLLADHYGVAHDIASVPQEDADVYGMISRADTIGVFQIESRAQMSMLPRLRPKNYYDLVIEVAIVRPGPIQGDMVHPYLRRRQGKETVDYPSEELRNVLKRTLGVPLFQEQAMQIAIVAAKFTPDEADGLRRAMATFRHAGIIDQYEKRLVEGMVANGYEREFAQRCFRQIEGFGEYGFPESHAASFAKLVYVSAWVKHHYPDVFCAAILNAQPMGFYAPAQLVRDAREHGVEVRPADVNASHWDSVLEPASYSDAQFLIRSSTSSLPFRGGSGWGVKDKTNRSARSEDIPPPRPSPKGEGDRAPARSPASPDGYGDSRPAPRYAVRLGLRQIKGLSEVAAARLVGAREAGGAFESVEALARRAMLDSRALDALAAADAFGSLRLGRRGGRWAARGTQAPLPLFEATGERAADPVPALPEMGPAEEVYRDYQSTRLSLKGHPMQFFRPRYACAGYTPCASLADARDGAFVDVSGLVLIRQRPGAGGVVFITLEDETGIANLIVWPKLVERFRRVVLTSRLIACRGKLQKADGVIHIVAHRLHDHGALLERMKDADDAGRFGDANIARCDVVKGGGTMDPREAAEAKRSERDARVRAASIGAGLPRSRDFH